MKIVFLFFPIILGDSSEERIHRSMERLQNILHGSPANYRSSSVSSASIPFGPFGMLSMVAKHLGDEGGLSESMEKRMEDSMDSLKDKLKGAVSESLSHIGSIKPEEDDSPISGVSTFTDVIGSLFGKLASTLGEIDPLDRRSPFGLADLIGNSNSQHICVREINRVFNSDNTTRRYFNECKYFAQAKTCKTTKINEEEVRETTRIQECCDGFSTGNIGTYGCNKEADYISPEMLFERYNISSQATVPKDSTLIFTSGSQRVYIFPQVFNDYDLDDGAILTTTQNDKFIVKINFPEYRSQCLSVSLNCIPFSESNIRMNTGRAHILTERLQPAAETVLELLQKDGRFKKFLSILSEETVVAFTNKSASHTVLPFTDEAFDKFPRTYQEQIDNRISCFATGIARAHIFQPAVCYGALSETIREIVRPIDANLFAFNGVVHVVDDLIVKEDLEPIHQKLKSLAPEMAKNLENKIDSSQTLTVFIPISLLNKINDSENEGSGQEYDIAEEMALNQVIPWYLPSIKALPPQLTTMGNTTIFSGTFGTPKISLFKTRFSIEEDSRAQIGCSKIIKEPCIQKEHIGACGASIFFLDVPIPKIEHNLLSLIRSRSDLSSFSKLLTSFLDDHNTLPKVATIIVPNNDSFSLNSLKRLEKSNSSLAVFVKRHLIPRPICEQDFKSSSIRPSTVSNKNGEHLKYKRENGELYVEDSKVLKAIVVSDGVVLIVDNAIIVDQSSSSSSSFIRFNI